MNKNKLFIPIEKEQRITAVLHGTIMGLKDLIEKANSGEQKLPDYYTEDYIQNQINICNSLYGGIKILSDFCNSTRKEQLFNLINDNIRNLTYQMTQTVDEEQRKRLQFNLDQWENIFDLLNILDRGIELVEDQKQNLIKDLK